MLQECIGCLFLFSQSKDKIKGFKSISTFYKLRYRDAFNSFCPCTPIISNFALRKEFSAVKDSLSLPLSV